MIVKEKRIGQKFHNIKNQRTKYFFRTSKNWQSFSISAIHRLSFETCIHLKTFFCTLFLKI